MVAPRKSRGGSSSSTSGICVLGRTRSLVTYTLVALAWGWAAHSWNSAHESAEDALPGHVAPTSSAKPARSLAGEARAPPSIPPPWDPQGCQTLAFFHVPKTGGMSVLGMNDVPWWRNGYSLTMLRVTRSDLETQANNLMLMKPWSNESRKLRHRIVEFHCGDTMSFMQARETLKAMRTEHEENGCGFFAFTVIRSPLEWLISKYNYTCSKFKGRTCPQKVLQEEMPPKEQILAYPHRNGQVSYLSEGRCGWAANGPVNESTVNEVASSLMSHLDHVALTDEVPELRRYLTKRFAAPDGVLTPEAEGFLERGQTRNANDAKVVWLGDFNPEELERLNSTIQLDWRLYERVVADHKPISAGDVVSTRPKGDRKS